MIERCIGLLVAFEGIDHVGKSTIAKEVFDKLKKDGIDSSIYSFPGKDEGTLGGLVYKIHHDQLEAAVVMDSLSKQMLHVAAHVDAIKNKIIPDICAGKIVVLDRFWWSTYAYGVGDNIQPVYIHDITHVERRLLNTIKNKIICYITRNSKENDFGEVKTKRILAEYDRLCAKTTDAEVVQIANNHTIDIAVESVMSAIILRR